MATNQNLLDRASYELGYIEYGASLDATDSAEALNVFNAMMHEWGVSSKDFNWFTQDTLGDTAPVPDWAESGVISNLAVLLGARFNVMVSNETAHKAKTGANVITRTLINQTLDNADMSHLPIGQGRYSRYDIVTDN